MLAQMVKLSRLDPWLGHMALLKTERLNKEPTHVVTRLTSGQLGSHMLIRLRC